MFPGEVQTFGGEGLGLVEFERAEGRVAGNHQRLGLVAEVLDLGEQGGRAPSHPSRVLGLEGFEGGARVDQTDLGFDVVITQPVFTLDQGQNRPGQAPRILVGAARERVPRGGEAVKGRPIEQSRHREMAEEDRGHAVEPLRVAGFEELRVRPVQRAPSNLIHGAVRRVEEEGAREGET